MKQTEEQYANELIDYYHNLLFINIDNHFEKFRHPESIKCAIQNVENTIKALTIAVNLEYGSTKIDIGQSYYQNVLQILKDKI